MVVGLKMIGGEWMDGAFACWVLCVCVCLEFVVEERPIRPTHWQMRDDTNTQFAMATQRKKAKNYRVAIINVAILWLMFCMKM